MTLTERENELIEEYKAKNVNLFKQAYVIRELEEAMKEHGYSYNEAIKDLHRIHGIHEPSLPFVIEEVDMTEEAIEGKIQEIMDGYNSRLKEGEPRFTREQAQDIMMELGMVGEDFFDYYDKLFKRNQG